MHKSDFYESLKRTHVIGRNLLWDKAYKDSHIEQDAQTFEQDQAKIKAYASEHDCKYREAANRLIANREIFESMLYIIDVPDSKKAKDKQLLEHIAQTVGEKADAFKTLPFQIFAKLHWSDQHTFHKHDINVLRGLAYEFDQIDSETIRTFMTNVGPHECKREGEFTTTFGYTIGLGHQQPTN